MPVCNTGTAQALCDAIESEFDSYSIPWSNVVGFVSDTVSVMVGANMSRFREKQPRVFTLGCLCHIAALCSVLGLKKLSLSIDDLLIVIILSTQPRNGQNTRTSWKN